MKEFWDILDQNGNKTGRLHEHGKPMQKGDYHLAVTVWIVNRKGEFLISKRVPTKNFPNMWEPTGGSAIVGEDSLSTALREVREELGVTLDPKNGQLFKRYNYPHSSDEGAAFFHTWIFQEEVDVSNITLQPEETCNVMWAGKEQIKQMVQDGTFIAFSYLDELFEKVSKF